jgi:cell division septation protein DedD
MGEGVYLVLMDYRGELSLQQARQYASGAFIKQVNGSPYVQIAAFRQLEYARHLADTLRGEGYAVVIAQ